MNTAQDPKKSAKNLKIPSLPAVVVKLNELVRDPNVGVLEIGEELAKDPELSTRVLRIANGASFGLQSPVLDPWKVAKAIPSTVLIAP